MSFLFGNPAAAERRIPPQLDTKPPRPEEPRQDVDQFYSDLMARRPALLDEKLKLHGRIIDEFNLALLDKLAPDELYRQVHVYVAIMCAPSAFRSIKRSSKSSPTRFLPK